MIRLSAKAAQKKTTPTRMIAGAVENTVYDFSFSETSRGAAQTVVFVKT